MDDLISRQAAPHALKAKALPLYKDPECNDVWEKVMTMMINRSLSAHWCDTCKHLHDDGYPCAECDAIKDNDLWGPKEGGNHDEN